MNKDQSLYFFAVIPPDEIQSLVTEIKLEFKAQYDAIHALKSPPHITLIPPFIFEISKEQMLVENLDKFSRDESVFRQKLEGFGFFPPRVIYIKVNSPESLARVFRRLFRYMDRAAGISSLMRNPGKFSAHMTVAHRDLTKESFQKARPLFEKREISFEFLVDGICLLKHNGRFWEIFHKSRFEKEK